jgi:hypothetical protein
VVSAAVDAEEDLHVWIVPGADCGVAEYELAIPISTNITTLLHRMPSPFNLIHYKQRL